MAAEPAPPLRDPSEIARTGVDAAFPVLGFVKEIHRVPIRKDETRIVQSFASAARLAIQPKAADNGVSHVPSIMPSMPGIVSFIVTTGSGHGRSQYGPVVTHPDRKASSTNPSSVGPIQGLFTGISIILSLQPLEVPAAEAQVAHRPLSPRPA